MTRPDPVIEARFEHLSVRWRWLRFLQHSATLATIITGLTLLLGVSLWQQWITNVWLAAGYLVVVVLGGCFAWLVVSILCASSPPDRRRLAASLESVHTPLLDRVNTLVYLEGKRDEVQQRYAECIQRQAHDVLIGCPNCSPFSAARALAHVGMFLAMLAATFWFFGQYHPWQQLRAAQASRPAGNSSPDLLLEIPPLEPPGSSVTQHENDQDDRRWGEVRISQPGYDVRATRADVIPLVIEAAAASSLEHVEWITAVNAEAERNHPLPQPEDPQYAVYKPEMFLEELGVKEWDVVSYFARAATDDGTTFESDLHFVDVVPFTPELEQIPGGPEGASSALREQLTAMIQRQEEVLRHLHRDRASAESPTSERHQRWNELAAEEDALAQNTEHLGAQAQSVFEPDAVASLVEHLDQAQSTLRESETSLRDERADDVQRYALKALSDLVAARQHFHQLLRDHPAAFEGQSNVAQQESLDDALGQISQREQQIQSAREMVQKSLFEERTIERLANPSNTANRPDLAKRQDELNKSFEKFLDQQPQCFQGLENQCASAQTAMQHAGQALGQKSPQARNLAGQAAEKLQQLDNALEQAQRQHELSKAYRLQQELDRQIEKLAQMRQQPQSVTPGQCQKTGGQCKAVVGQLKEFAEQPGSGFGAALREALSDQNQQQLEDQADQLSAAETPDQIGQAAGELERGLEAISDAFDASRPNGLADNRHLASQARQGQEAIARGLMNLESLARRHQQGRQLDPQTETQLRQSAWQDLSEGIPAVYGYNEHSRQLLRALEKDVQEPLFVFDLQTIRRLAQRIQTLRRESATDTAGARDEQELMQIDPARLPAEYRRAIERYYRQLSEQREDDVKEQR